jgi:hypothetical protein
MEVLMRNIINAFLTISFIAVLGAASYAQTIGLRVEANIPFDFTVGESTFAGGSYELLLTRNHNSVYSASLLDSEGKVVLKTTAIRTGATSRENSNMEFAVSGGGHFLEKLRTPDMGFQFAVAKSNRLIAKTQKVNVPAKEAGAPNF